MNKYVIGIDLGTTNSAAAVMINNNVEIIPNDLGHRTTPSYVSFTNDEYIVGNVAKSKTVTNIKNTIYDVKRLMGKTYDNIDLLNINYSVVNKNNYPIIEVNYRNQLTTFTPVDISSMILTKMKKISQDYINVNITDAVITVPAYFNETQRTATKDAATLAGLNILRIINEPTAAAIAYGLNKNCNNKNVLIFDLGGGTFDVSILNISDEVFEVKSTAGNTHLGGEDFDDLLIEYIKNKFNQEHNVDISNNIKALRRLKNECEKAKCILSSMYTTNIEIESFYNSIDLNVSISRDEFNILCDKLFKECLSCVEQALNDAKLSKSQIDDIVLIGGSSRIPKIQSLLSEYFNNKQLCKSINPDEAVAYGAAVYANSLINQSNIVLLDVIPLSLGIQTSGDIMTILINKNTPIPTKVTKIFSTANDNQSGVSILIYQGERVKASENTLLGKFDIVGIKEAKRGQAKIEVTYEIDVNGILTVSAIDKVNNIIQQITVSESNKLTESEIQEKLLEAEKYKQQDQEYKNIIEIKHKLEQLTYSTRDNILNDNKLSNTEKENISEYIYDTIQWISNNSNNDYILLNNKYNELYDKVKLFFP